VSFFRSCRFWRIRISDCFAYSFTPDHPSRIKCASGSTVAVLSRYTGAHTP
jgi:hypothetical protein